MLYQGPSTPTELSNAFDKAWQVSDQEGAFAAFNYAPSGDSVSTGCAPLLVASGCVRADLKAGLKVTGTDVSALLLNQALDYFQKGIYNFFTQYLVARAGLQTWASITNYYASFFFVHALLCLQGRTITRLVLVDGQDRCHVMPLDLTKHEFVFCSKGLSAKGGEHALPWVRYYGIYDNYAHPVPEFEVVYKNAYSVDPKDESDQRNLLNYVPFKGFGEINSATAMDQFKRSYIAAVSFAPGLQMVDYLTVLRPLATDPDFKYFARVALRLLLIADIFKRVAQQNVGFAAEWQMRLPQWKAFSLSAFSDPPENLFESLTHVLE
jgi:hypothetical protein